MAMWTATDDEAICKVHAGHNRQGWHVRQECAQRRHHKSITLARVSSQLEECKRPPKAPRHQRHQKARRGGKRYSHWRSVTSNGVGTKRSIASRIEIGSLPRRWAHSCLRKAMQTIFLLTQFVKSTAESRPAAATANGSLPS